MVTVEISGVTETAMKLRLSHKSKREAARRGVARATIFLSSYIKEHLLSGQVLNTRTGNLRRAVYFRLEGDSGVVAVDPSAWYGKLHEYGVEHGWWIEAKEGSALAFDMNGQRVVVRKVWHPGLKERSFMRRGLTEARPRIIEIIQEEVGGASSK